MYQLLLITPFPAISSKSERYRVTSNWIYKRGIWLHSAVVGEVNGMQFDQAGRVVPDYPIRYFNWIITGKRDSLLKIIDSQIEYFKNCNYMSKMMNFDALKEATVKGIVWSSPSKRPREVSEMRVVNRLELPMNVLFVAGPV